MSKKNNGIRYEANIDHCTFEIFFRLLIAIVVIAVMGVIVAIVTGIKFYTPEVIETIETTEVEQSSNVSKNYTEEDVRLLARLIYGEAGGEPYEGQVAVGAVVMNRVKTQGFPNTIEEVIFQKRQFSCVDDGNFYKEIPSYSTVYDAARAALEGEDPTNGCVYFYNPVTSTSSWIFENTETVVTIGNHRFAVGK